MPSHLTRQVFRRLLANEPIVHRGCLRRQAYSSAASGTALASGSQRQHGFPAVRPVQRRTFFNFNMFRKPKRELKEADMDPGIEKMMNLEKMQRMRARLPPPEHVAKALKDFFAAKRTQKKGLEDTQAQLALQSVRYCLASQQEQTDGADMAASPLLSEDFFASAARNLRYQPKQLSDAHVELAKLVYDTLAHASNQKRKAALVAYCYMLCLSGSPEKARELLLQRAQPSQSEGSLDMNAFAEESGIGDSADVLEHGSSNIDVGLVGPSWLYVLRGFASAQDEVEVQRTLVMMSERGLPSDGSVPEIMLDFYISQERLPDIRGWWDQYQQATTPRSPRRIGQMGRTVGRLLKWCLRSNNVDFGHEVVRDLMKTNNPPKPVWDAIFVWAAGTGKGVEEIGRMLDVMQSSNTGVEEREQWREPDTHTINALVEFATSKDDPYMAERFIALGRDRGIEPDARTYVLQMDYRLSVTDVDGALTAYKNLQAMDLSSDEDLPTVNKLLVALCTSNRHDFDTIMNVAADLSDRRARFAPRTVATLSLLHLNRDELHDVIDLLNTHAFHYSSADRASISDALVAYTLDPSTSTPRAWDAYTILRNIFDELPRDPRTQLMASFFTRSRPDMAVHIFNHMRAHSRADTIPTPATYIAAFMGAARLHDLESLEVLHNQLKLDFNIDITTQVRNALVLAYTACEKPRKALQFWDEIVASKEGPSYNSIHIALRACERSAFGDLKAREIWEKLRRMNVEMDRSMWASYAAALAGNGDTGAAIKELEAAEGKGEVEVDAFVLGSVFEAAPGMSKQGEVEAWGRERYAGVWGELEGMGVEEDEAGMRRFGVEREVMP